MDNSEHGNIPLKKDVYGVKGALEALDEQFNEFALGRLTAKEFFNIYNRFFYDLPSDTHKLFIKKSMEYAMPDGYQHPLVIEKQSLINQKNDLQKKIDELEREHFYIKNRVFLMDATWRENPTSKLQEGEPIWYMHSNKKRLVINYQDYVNLKSRRRIEDDDKDFIVFLTTQALDGIENGPDITTPGDILISNLEVNIYPRTLEEYLIEFGIVAIDETTGTILGADQITIPEDSPNDDASNRPNNI